MQEGHLIDRATAGTQAGGHAAVERDAHHEGTVRPLGIRLPERGPHVHRIVGHIEHAPGRAEHAGGGAGHARRRQVALADRMQGRAFAGFLFDRAAMDAVGRQDAFEIRWGGTGAPVAQRGQRVGDFAIAIERQVDRRVEDQGVAHQPAGVVAGGVVIAAAQLVGVAVAQAAVLAQVEQADLGTAARVAVTDHHHAVVADQHLVVPGAARIHVWGEGIHRRHRLQAVAADAHGEQAAAAQHHQVVAAALDDVAFVHALGLVVGDRFAAGCIGTGGGAVQRGGRFHDRGRCRRCGRYRRRTDRNRHRHHLLFRHLPPLLCFRLAALGLQEGLERRFVGEGRQALGGRACR